MDVNEILEEMKQIRKECRILNADIIQMKTKQKRQIQSIESLKKENQNLNRAISSMKTEVNSHEIYNIDDLKLEIQNMDKEIQEYTAQYNSISNDILHLNEALNIQKESNLKQNIYGHIHSGYQKVPQNQINKEGAAIALKKSLEEELKALEKKPDIPTRIIAKKRSQLSRADNLCC